MATMELLSAHVIVNGAWPPSLVVSGMRNTKSGQQHVEWVSEHLRPGDEICIAYLGTGRASKPVCIFVTEVRDIQSVEEELRRLQTQLADFEARAAAEPISKPPTWTRAPRPRTLRVSTRKKHSIHAHLDGEEQLQAIINMTGRRCVLEVNAMTVQEDGSTRGKRWLQKKLRLGQQVTITYTS